MAVEDVIVIINMLIIERLHGNKKLICSSSLNKCRCVPIL